MQVVAGGITGGTNIAKNIAARNVAYYTIEHHDTFAVDNSPHLLTMFMNLITYVPSAL